MVSSNSSIDGLLSLTPAQGGFCLFPPVLARRVPRTEKERCYPGLHVGFHVL